MGPPPFAFARLRLPSPESVRRHGRAARMRLKMAAMSSPPSPAA
jgi:hypothetical protein